MRNLFFFGLVVLCLIAIQKFIPNLISSSDPEPIKASDPDDDYVHTLKTVHLVESFKDDKEWELFADSARNKASASAWLLQKVKVNFLDQEGRMTRVAGDEATFHSNERRLHIFGNVTVETQNGYLIKTKEIFYTSMDRQLFTLNEVAILRREDGGGRSLEGSFIEGGYMRTSMQNNEMLLGGNVKANKTLERGRKLSVLSGQARLSREQGSVEFYEEVEIAWGASRFSGEMAQFVYNEKLNQLEQVILTKNVRIQSEARYAICERAVLDIQSGITELSGRPKVVESGNQVEGDSIVLNHEDDTVSVTNMKANFEERR